MIIDRNRWNRSPEIAAIIQTDIGTLLWLLSVILFLVSSLQPPMLAAGGNCKWENEIITTSANNITLQCEPDLQTSLVTRQ